MDDLVLHEQIINSKIKSKIKYWLINRCLKNVIFSFWLIGQNV